MRENRATGASAVIRKMILTNANFENPTATIRELRGHAAPLELLRNTLVSRFERGRAPSPDSQFEFLPRRLGAPAQKISALRQPGAS